MDNLESYLSQPADELKEDPPQLLREVAYARIKDAIRHAELRPGQPLSEMRLSKLLGISRTPVREALQVLAQEGLVQIIPGRAVTVAAPSVQEVLNIVHIRSILEPEVARLAAETIPPDQLAGLKQSLERMHQAVMDQDRNTWSMADSVFHEILSTVCPNQLLGEMAVQMRNRVSYVAVDSQTTWERIAACTDEHHAVVEAIEDRDGEQASRAMREHIRKLRESLFKRLTHL